MALCPVLPSTLVCVAESDWAALRRLGQPFFQWRPDYCFAANTHVPNPHSASLPRVPLSVLSRLALPLPPPRAQVILASGYDASADIWSLACMLFELVTGDFLFDPRAGSSYSRDEDHLAQMIELLGRMPRSVSLAGRRSREFFTRDGRLRNIHRLNHWPLDRVLREKYHLPRDEVRRGFPGVFPLLFLVGAMSTLRVGHVLGLVLGRVQGCGLWCRAAPCLPSPLPPPLFWL